MKVSAKLSSEERRAAIVKAVRRVFADRGFHGTTTKALAEAAGVSEALLFKHFPNKEALFAAMQTSCCGAEDSAEKQQLCAMEPSAATLAVLVHLLVSHMLGGEFTGDDDETIQIRLVLRSLMEDGEFARQFLQGMPSHWVGKVEECINAAVVAGDAVGGVFQPGLSGWFAHHVAAMLMIHLLPSNPVVDYGVERPRLVEQAVRFILRGMGLKDKTIERHYDPKRMAQLADQMFT
jgi:AcrR family transcriptional regulator